METTEAYICHIEGQERDRKSKQTKEFVKYSNKNFIN